MDYYVKCNFLGITSKRGVEIFVVGGSCLISFTNMHDMDLHFSLAIWEQGEQMHSFSAILTSSVAAISPLLLQRVVYIQLSQLFCVDLCNCVVSNVDNMNSVEHSYLYYLCMTYIHHSEERR